MRQSHLIISNALIIWASRVLLLVPQVVLVPYLISTIGEVGYGVYALIWSLLMGIDQLERSLQSGVVKYSAGYLADGRIEDVNRMVSSSFVFSLVLGVLAAASICGIALIWQSDAPGMTSALLVVAGLMLLIIPLTPYLAVIQSRQCYYVNAIADTLSKYLGLAVIFTWFTWVAPSVGALIIITAGMLFLSRLVQVPVAYRLVPSLRNRPGLCDKEALRGIMTFGVVIVLASFCLVANNAGVRWLMELLVSPSFVAHLAIVLMPGALLAQAVRAATITVMPATSAYEAQKNQSMLQELLVRGIRYTTFLVVPAVVVAALLMRPVIRLWVGAEYEFLAPYATLLLVGNSFMLTTSTGHHMLKGLGRLKDVLVAYVLGLVAVPAILILMVLLFGHSPYSAVVSGLIAGSTVCGALQIAYSGRAVSADMRALLFRAYVQPLLLGAGICAASFFIVVRGGVDSLPGRLLASCLTVLLFFSCSYALVANAQERRQVREFLQSIGSRLRPLLRRDGKR